MTDATGLYRPRATHSAAKPAMAAGYENLVVAKKVEIKCCNRTLIRKPTGIIVT